MLSGGKHTHTHTGTHITQPLSHTHAGGCLYLCVTVSLNYSVAGCWNNKLVSVELSEQVSSEHS